MSVSSIDYSLYSTILFMDSMVALEGKPLVSQPWAEIDPSGPILVLVVPQVNTEIDKRKRDGRLGKRAREFNRLLAPAAEAATATQIVRGPPIVDIAIATCDRIDWDTLDDLDPNEPDARVVAQILHARGVPQAQKLLFSHDINPIAMASRHGLKCRKMPESWLAEPEASPHEKELMRLKGRVKELETTEPSFELTLEFEPGEAPKFYKVRPLTGIEQNDESARIIRKNPKIAQDNSPFSSALGTFDSGYGTRYKKFCEVTVPRHAASLHTRIETHYNQISFVLSVTNSGHIQAENLVIAVKSIGGRLHDHFACFPIFGPAAPRPKPQGIIAASQLSMRTFADHLPRHVNRHDVHFPTKPNRAESIEAHCADFRHGRTWSFNGFAQINPRSGSPLKVLVEITASNMRGKFTRTFDLEYRVEDVALSDLIDIEDREYHVEIPLMTQFNRALEMNEENWFTFIRDDSSDDDY